MKKWECDVCGFVHEGEEPPEKCPVCDSPGTLFALMIEAKKEEAKVIAGKRWRCIVCGYVHEGDEPPEICPVCAAPKSMFVEIDAEGKEIGTPLQPAQDSAPLILESVGTIPGGKKEKSSFIDRVAGLSLKIHLHPIMVHFPNGVLPVVLVFLVISIIFRIASFETAAYYNLVFVLLTLPFVLITGFLEWQKRYKGVKTAIFVTKIMSSLIVFAAVSVLVFWRLLDPDVLAEESPTRFIYLGVAAGMLGAAGIAGYLGGRLVFGTRRND